MPSTLFLADQLVHATRTSWERHPGGAELTDAAAMDACPWSLTVKTFAELHLDELGRFDVIVVGNSQSAKPHVLDAIARTGRHVLFEHDLRICDWRGNLPSTRDPWHRGHQRCWCPHLAQRKLYDRALGVIFLTNLQLGYFTDNPFFRLPPYRILGCSLFSPRVFEEKTKLAPDASRSGTVIFASPQRIKGAVEARAYCAARGIVPTEIAGLTPDQVLAKFGAHERFVYLPIGPEWAGRVVVEARVLGCEVVTNRHVGVAQEAFWNGPASSALEHLATGPQRFWQQVEELLAGPARRAPEPRPRVLPYAARAALSATRTLHVPRALFPMAGPESAPPSVSPPW